MLWAEWEEPFPFLNVTPAVDGRRELGSVGVKSKRMRA